MARHTEAVLRRLHQAADHGSLRIQIATSRSNKRGSPYGGVLEKASSALRDTNCPIWPLMPVRIRLAERIVPDILIQIQALGIIRRWSEGYARHRCPVLHFQQVHAQQPPRLRR